MQDLDVKKSKMLALFVLLRLKIVVCTIVRSNRALVAKNVNSGGGLLINKEDRSYTNIS